MINFVSAKVIIRVLTSPGQLRNDLSRPNDFLKGSMALDTLEKKIVRCYLEAFTLEQ